ncbi:MAG: histidine phosphatase family protein [Candidatus Acidiferrum sp.]
MARNGHNGNGKPTRRELRDATDRAVRMADRTVGAYSVEPTVAPRATGSVEPGTPKGARKIPLIPSATFDPVRAEGNWAPLRPVPEPIPGILPGFDPKEQMIGTAQWGGTGTPITAGFLTDLGEYNADLYGRSAVATYEKMRRGDAQVWGTLMAVKGPLQSATWDIEPGVKSNDPGHGKAKQVAEFVKENIMGGLEFQTSSGGWHSQPWDQIMWNALLCLDFGCAVHEDVYTVDGKYLKLRALVPLHPITYYRWHVESDGYTLLGLEQYGYRGIEFINATVPAEKICRFTLNQEGSNFWGLSLLRACYGSWYIKSQLYRIDALASERNGLGVPVITLPEGASTQDRATAFNFVTKLSAHELTGLVLPFGGEFAIKGVEGQPREVYRSIEHHNRMISTTALAMFLTIGSAPHGSRATAATQHDFFLAASQHLASYIGKRFTQTTIRRLVQYNFGEDAVCPELIAKNVKMRDFEDVREALQDLAKSGLLVSDEPLRNTIRDEYELPPETDQGILTTKGEQVENEEDQTIAGLPGGGSQPSGTEKQQAPTAVAGKKQVGQRAKANKGVPSKGKNAQPVNDQLAASDTPFTRTDGTDHETLTDEPTIYGVRHGVTADDENPKDEIISSWSDIPLTDVGKEQAEHAGERLKDKGIAEIYTSDLPRALETAQIIAGIIGAEVIEDRGLRGWNVGGYAGRSANDELDNGRTISEELNWLQENPKVKPPMGDSWSHTEARIGDAIERITKRAETSGKPVAFVTHSRVLNSLPSLSRGKLQAEGERKGAGYGLVDKAVKDGNTWYITYNAKKLSDSGYHSIGDDPGIPIKNNRSGQPTQRRTQKKTVDGPPSDESQEEHPATPSLATGGQAPTKRGNPQPVGDVMAKQASHGARIVHDKDMNLAEGFKPSASQERNISPVPRELQPSDKQDTPLNPTPDPNPVVKETFSHAGAREISAVVGKKKGGTSMVMETIIFPKTSWKSSSSVKSWLKSHGKKTKIDETGTSYRARQADPKSFESKSFRTIQLNSETMSETADNDDGRVLFQDHHGEEAAEDLRQHYAGIFAAIQKKITGPLKAKVIAAVVKQASRQIKAGVPVPQLHFVADHALESMLNVQVGEMYKKAKDQAKKEVNQKRKRQ